MSKIQSIFSRLSKNLLINRAFHTFIQAFLSTVILGIPTITASFKLHGVSDAEAAGVALLIAAGAAGLSALRTGVSNIVAARQANANTAQQV